MRPYGIVEVMKTKILLFSRVAISFIFIFIIWWSLKDKAHELILNLQLSRKNWLFLAFLILTLNIFLIAIRLKMVFSIQKLDLTVKEAIQLSLIGFFFNSFLPTSIGGDIVKAYYASEKFNHRKVESYAAVLADRTIGLVSILSIALAALLIAGEQVLSYNMKLSIFIIFALVIFLIYFSLNKGFASKFKFILVILKKIKLENIAKRTYIVFNSFKNHKRISLLVIITSIAAQVAFVLIYFILSKSLSLKLPFLIFLLFIPVVMAASLIPSLGGTGPREGCFIVLFAGLVGEAKAMALALMWLGCFLSLGIAGGIVYLLSEYRHIPFKEIKKEMDYDK